MTAEELRRVLEMVANGELSADEAAPVVEALGATPGPSESGADRAPPSLRIEVTEGGRSVVNLRVPTTLAADHIPGLPAYQLERVRAALRAGVVGRLLEVVDENGDGVRIDAE